VGTKLAYLLPSIRLAPPWAAVAITVAVLITGGVGAGLAFGAARLDRRVGVAKARRSYLSGVTAASGIAASLRPVAIFGTWLSQFRHGWPCAGGMALSSLAALAVTFAVEAA